MMSVEYNVRKAASDGAALASDTFWVVRLPASSGVVTPEPIDGMAALSEIAAVVGMAAGAGVGRYECTRMIAA